jgi:F-type H+-transporting ATPase subunit b
MITTDHIVTGIFTIINLLVTYFVLKRFLFKPVMTYMKKRQTNIENDLREAQAKIDEAEMRTMEATEKVEGAVKEASGIVGDAKVSAESQRDSILASARQEAADLLKRADGDIARMRNAMLEDMKTEVAELSVAIATKVIGQSVDQDRQKELVSRLVDDELKGRVEKNG